MGLVTVKKQITKQLRSKLTRRVFTRCVLTVIALFGLHIAHGAYTMRYFGYELLISDGFVRYLPFVLLSIFFVLFFFQIQEFIRKDKTKMNIIFLLVGIMFFFIPIKKVGFLGNVVDLIFAEYFILLFGTIVFLLGVFGVRFFHRFKTELLILLLITIPFVLAPILIDHFWEYSSKITMFGLKLFFELFQMDYVMRPETYNVVLESFSVFIGPPCAGIHSLLAFGVLFSTLILLGQQKGHRFVGWKVAVSFLLGLLCVFIVNTLRVLLIILVGAYYDPDFAINLFHNNIGAILLIAFFILYVKLSWKFIRKQKTPSSKTFF